MCKRIGYKYYCEELFVIKSKTRYSCASMIYFNLESDVIKVNCEFQSYYNKTDIKPTIKTSDQSISKTSQIQFFLILTFSGFNLPLILNKWILPATLHNLIGT